MPEKFVVHEIGHTEGTAWVKCTVSVSPFRLTLLLCRKMKEPSKNIQNNLQQVEVNLNKLQKMSNDIKHHVDKCLGNLNDKEKMILTINTLYRRFSIYRSTGIQDHGLNIEKLPQY